MHRFLAIFALATLMSAQPGVAKRVTVQPGKYVVRGRLKYQACDNAACYPPQQLPVSFDVRIGKAAAAGHKNPAQSPNSHK